MIIQHVVGKSENGNLVLHWQVFHEIRAITVQIAKDSEFQIESHMFTLPPVLGCALDTGPGAWFVRIGGWVGDTRGGRILWSGIPSEAVRVESNRPNVLTKDSILRVASSQPIPNGLRIHVSPSIPYYSILEYSKEEGFKASQTTTLYAHDWGRGHVDCMGLTYPLNYYIRVSFHRENPGDLLHDSVRQVCQGGVLSLKTASRPLEFASTDDLTKHRTDELLLRKVKETPGYKFTSHADYMKYKLALASQLRG